MCLQDNHSEYPIELEASRLITKTNENSGKKKRFLLGALGTFFIFFSSYLFKKNLVLDALTIQI